MYIVVEPGQRSLTVAADVARLAKDLGIPAIWVVANKVRTEEDLAFVREHLDGLRLAGWLPRDDRVVEADMQGLAVYDAAPELVRRVEAIAKETGMT